MEWTKVAAGFVDSQGSIFGRARFPTDKSSPKATLDCIAQAVEAVIHHHPASRKEIQGVGLGVPGLVDPQRGIGIAAVNIGWENEPVKTEMETRLGLPCFVENDVKAATLGEAHGAGRGRQNLVYLSIGTGIGGGDFDRAKALPWTAWMAGEIGHAVVDPKGPLCKCGARAAWKQLHPDRPSQFGLKRSCLLHRGPCLRIRYFAGKGPSAQRPCSKRLSKGMSWRSIRSPSVSEYLAFTFQFLALAYDPETIILSGRCGPGRRSITGFNSSPLKRQADESWVLGKFITLSLSSFLPWERISLSLEQQH